MSILIKWLNHASFKISIDETTIFIDLEEKSPVTSKADIILITHSHFDHCHPTKVEEASNKDTLIIAPKDCAKILRRDVKSLQPGEEETIGEVKIKAVEAYNVKRFRSPGNPYHPKGFGVGYLIEANDAVIYHAGDTDFIPEMSEIGEIDVALIPSGGTYTMDNTDATEAILKIKPKVAIPMHRWDTDPKGLKQNVEANSNVNVAILKEGEIYKV